METSAAVSGILPTSPVGPSLHPSAFLPLPSANLNSSSLLSLTPQKQFSSASQGALRAASPLRRHASLSDAHSAFVNAAVEQLISPT